MEVPVCLDGCCVGEMSVMPVGRDTELRVRCTGLPAGLYRLYACGAGGELLLGVTEDGCLHRRFSAAMTAPLGVVERCRAQPAAAPQWRGPTPPDGLPWAVPAGTLLRRADAVGRTVAAGRAVPADGAFLLRLRGAAAGKPVCLFLVFRRMDALYAGKNRKKLKNFAAGTTTSCVIVVYCWQSAAFCRSIGGSAYEMSLLRIQRE